MEFLYFHCYPAPCSCMWSSQKLCTNALRLSMEKLGAQSATLHTWNCKLKLHSFCVKHCNHRQAQEVNLKCIGHAVSLFSRVCKSILLRHCSQETTQLSSLVVVSLKMCISLIPRHLTADLIQSLYSVHYVDMMQLHMSYHMILMQ